MKQICIRYKDNYTAGGKAKMDALSIMKQLDIECDECKCIEKADDFHKAMNEIKKSLFLFSRRNNEYIIQYPFSNTNFTNNILISFEKKNKVVLLLHDIEGLRFANSKRLEQEKRIFQNARFIIAHNKFMTKYLVDEMQVIRENIFSLDLFDYLTDSCIEKREFKEGHEPTICYAGNLSRKKSPFLYEKNNKEIHCTFNVYGIGLEEKMVQGNIKYQGSYGSTEIVDKMKGDFGLVWDGCGNSNDEDNPLKNYTKYNNPHKMSLYMAAKLPVLVWRKSAAAAFVEKHKIGFCIDKITDINDLTLTAKQYAEFQTNIEEISNKVSHGLYLKDTIKKIQGRWQ